MIKIYFGRQPKTHFEVLDNFFNDILVQQDYHFERAIIKTLEWLTNNNINGEDRLYWTINPLIPNFMDDNVVQELFWMIDEDGNHIHVKEDEHMLKKFSCMGGGEVLCDDYRSFK